MTGAKPEAGAAWKEKQRRVGGRRQTEASVGVWGLEARRLGKDSDMFWWSPWIITLVELWIGGCKFSKHGIQ